MSVTTYECGNCGTVVTVNEGGAHGVGPVLCSGSEDSPHTAIAMSEVQDE